MNRNLAFIITSNSKELNYFNSSKKHLIELTNQYKYKTKEINTVYFKILISYEGELSLIENKNILKFPVGNINNNEAEYDRFLKVTIKDNVVSIENDYAGTIPVYYSSRKYLTLSNIEPCVMLGSGAKKEDISYENIYGFMRYMHFIWDETLYSHIFTMLPDSLYTFNASKLDVKEKYLQTVKPSEIHKELTNGEVAKKLNDLNDKLVYRSLEKFDQIILPLSSGYDSRMILASLCKRKDLKEKLFCFTYGSEGSVEVEAARRLTNKLGIKWYFIDLPLQFLTKDYLFEIHNIFGSSLHMHGMYQLEFFNELTKVIKIKKNCCLTSGFMTGVPAGQHNSLLMITNNENLTNAMNKFSQSCYWTDEDLNKFEIFKGKNYLNKAEDRFRQAFDRFNGNTYQQAVMFDVWTRQRNFIGYYPRIFEWNIPTISPHMNKEYINFFMSISKKHLDDRLSIELMFSTYYPELSKIISNSNGLRSINSLFENSIFLTSRIFRKLRLSFLLPIKYRNNNFEFSLPSVRYSERDSFYPLLNDKNGLEKIISKKEIEELYLKSCAGDIESYEKIVTIQSIALSILKMDLANEC